MSGQGRHGLGDPRISWTVLLTATLTSRPDATVIAARLDAMARAQSWSPPLPLTATVDGCELTLAADHRHLDGQAMLTALSVLLDESVRSMAAGVEADRPRAGLGLGGVERLVEAVLRPSVVVPPTSPGDGESDAIAHARLPRRVTTSDLIVAATRALDDDTTRPISVAVGVAMPAGEDLADNSGYLRIRDARGLSRAEISGVLRHAPLQPGGGEASGVVGAVAGVATKVLASRLGSTVLVSHLGDVAADGLADLAFYPVSGGASGLSLGAATVDERTTVTLRARGDRHSRDGLERLLETITAAID